MIKALSYCLYQQIQELEAEFEKFGNEKVVQTRFLRSQQDLKAKMEAQEDEDGDEGTVLRLLNFSKATLK